MKALLLVVLGLGLLTACSTSRAPLCASGAPDQSSLAGYRLGPHDHIKVTVFRQPDLSGQFALDGEGSLALPLVGNIRAGSLTTRELEDEIERPCRRKAIWSTRRSASSRSSTARSTSWAKSAGPAATSTATASR